MKNGLKWKNVSENTYGPNIHFKKEGLLFTDDQKAIDKLKEYLPKDGFLRMSYDWYIKAMNPEIREVWSNYMKTIVETIYKINKPVTHKVRLTRIE